MTGMKIYNARVLVLIAAIGLIGASARAQTPGPGYAGPGRYEIENVAGGKVLDLNRQDQHTVVQWPRTHAQSQLWDIEDAGNGYVYVKSPETGLTKDIDGAPARPRSPAFTSPPPSNNPPPPQTQGTRT